MTALCISGSQAAVAQCKLASPEFPDLAGLWPLALRKTSSLSLELESPFLAPCLSSNHNNQRDFTSTDRRPANLTD